MSGTEKKVCPECQGQKIIPGTCVCNMEWRGTLQGTVAGDEWDECQCNESEKCPLCLGVGYIEEETNPK